MYRFTCPVPSSLALVLLASTAVAQPGHITAAYHPRASSCFFSSSLQVFDCFSLATSTTATHADSRAAAFRDKKRTAVPTRRFTCTIVHNNKTSDCLLLLEAKAKTLEAAQKTQRKTSRASKIPTHTRERPTAGKLSLDPPAWPLPKALSARQSLLRHVWACLPAQRLQ